MTDQTISSKAAPNIIVIGDAKLPEFDLTTAFHYGVLLNIWGESSIDKLWSADQIAAAADQGWAISAEQGIVRKDGSPRFETDEQALAFVTSEAKGGVELAKHALSLHGYIDFRLRSMRESRKIGPQGLSAGTKEPVVQTPWGDFSIEQPVTATFTEAKA